MVEYSPYWLYLEAARRMSWPIIASAATTLAAAHCYSGRVWRIYEIPANHADGSSSGITRGVGLRTNYRCSDWQAGLSIKSLSSKCPQWKVVISALSAAFLEFM